MFSGKRTCLWVGGLLCFFIAETAVVTPLLANTETDSIKVRSLDEVVIAASKTRFSAVSPMPLQSLSGEQLKSLNSFSVADAIRYFSGVQLKDYGGIGGLKTVNVRSLGSAHTAVFYDGLQLGNAQNGQVDLGKFSMENIEEIQLYNGQKSSIFQPAKGFFASNSLYLKSKTPQLDSSKRCYAQGGVKTGSFGLFDMSVLWQQRLSKTLSYSANAELCHANGRYNYRYTNGTYDTAAVRQNGDVRALRVETALFGKLRKGQWNVKMYYYNSRRGLPGAIVANRYSHFQRQWDRNFFVQGSLQKAFGKRYELMANVKFSSDYTRYVDPEYITLYGALDNRYRQYTYYLSVVQQEQLTPWCGISLATDMEINTLDANLYRFPYPVRYTFLGVLSTHINFPRFDMQASLLACAIDEQVQHFQPGGNRQLLCPVVSASFQPFATPSFRIRAFYKETFRMPTFNDLYYTFIGNSSLRPEYTAQYDAGATWTLLPAGILSRFSIQADGYYNRVKDKIVAMPSSNLFRWTMMNLGEVEIKGVETNLAAELKILRTLWLNIGLSYTYQKTMDITPKSTTYGDRIPYAPVHSGSLTAALTWEKWQVNYSFIYTGERYCLPANIPQNYVQPWYTSDLALNWQAKWKKSAFKITSEVNNLFNQYYDVVFNFPMPGRNFRIGVSVSF